LAPPGPWHMHVIVDMESEKARLAELLAGAKHDATLTGVSPSDSKLQSYVLAGEAREEWACPFTNLQEHAFLGRRLCVDTPSMLCRST
jgi:hypothetical protein